MADTLIHQRVAAARDGTNPTVVTRVHSGWVVAPGLLDRRNAALFCPLRSSYRTDRGAFP